MLRKNEFCKVINKFTMDRIEQIHKLLELQPDDVFLHYALAMEFVSVDKYDEAISKLEFIRNSHPDYLPLYYQLAGLYEKTGLSDKAINIYSIGMQVAEKSGDRKTYGELRSAYEELTF